MHPDKLKSLLEAVRSGAVSPDAAVQQLRGLPFESLGFAHVDHHRAIRCGFPEVIFSQGKTSAQVAAIFDRLVAGGGNVLATRARRKDYERVVRHHETAEYHKAARCITLRQKEPQWSNGTIAIVSAGTSDQRIAEEARVTAEIMDQRTASIYDVGVAGLHRLLAQVPALQTAHVIIVVAGMEGALPSVVCGLVSVPVIAVPTSVGYGASLGGMTPLLAMLNSCAAGVAVVNIDNGFGAGFLAAQINRLTERGPTATGAPRSETTNADTPDTIPPHPKAAETRR